ncbi:MAG TPA: ISKra4 family transposase [Planctomycetota bacterium]|nr:ISKra4 family transposase [Planctomycetota bacterium]
MHLLRRVLALGRCLLGAWFAGKRGGDVGKAIVTASGELLPRERSKSRRYLSVFGELELARCYYHEEGSPGLFPLEEEANLPEEIPSHFVQQLALGRTARMTYDEAIGELEELFGFTLRKETLIEMAATVAADADPYYESQGTPRPETEGEILVVAADGKGVPILKGEPAEHRVRLRKGEKHSRKKEAVVAAVYTIAAQPRTAEDVVREVRDKQPPAQRPKPQNKRLRAPLNGKEDAFAWVQQEVARRDPEGRKRRVCLTDAGTGLQRLALAMLGGFTLILDLFHALEYLWKAAHVFHPEGSDEAEAFVRERLRMLLEGRVGHVIGGLRQKLTKHRHRLRKPQRKVLQTVIGYYEANRRWMHYDDSLAAGYPVGSGAAEGACRHLVKDRMEGSGMRWSLPGAEAILKTRAVFLNGDWDPFWQFHMQCDRQRRFGARRWSPVVPSAAERTAA